MEESIARRLWYLRVKSSFRVNGIVMIFLFSWGFCFFSSWSFLNRNYVLSGGFNWMEGKMREGGREEFTFHQVHIFKGNFMRLVGEGEGEGEGE